MSIQTTLEIRKEELRRRVLALPNEVKRWQNKTSRDLDSNLHSSQLQAIGILMDTFTEQQNRLLADVDPGGDTAVFPTAALELVHSIIRSQQTWDFFRDKFELRYSPIFKEVLWVADTVVWDCYRPVLDAAADAGILERTAFREPPLTYLAAEFSPATWVRGSRPKDGRDYHLGTSLLPIPVIELPWDHVENTWELLTLHHEVGHELEADLGLRHPLGKSISRTLGKNGVPLLRIKKKWLKWQGEVFADLVGLQLGGPAFAEAFMHLLLLPPAMVTTFDESDPHPTPYPRMLMQAAFIPTMIPGNQALAEHSQQIADGWTAIYGDQPQFEELIGDFPLVFQALMDTPLPELKGKTVRELVPYTPEDDRRIRKAIGYMRTGIDRPADLRPRHCLSAARLAVTRAALDGALSSAVLDNINRRAMELVRANAPSGVRGGDESTPHRKFIAGFVERTLPDLLG